MTARFLPLVLALLLAAACAPRFDGTPMSVGPPGPGQGGIGGTGALAAAPLGAGSRVGVFGTVTGFGSVQVGGVRVALPAGVPLASAIPGAPPAPGLAIGESVAIEARAAADGELVAGRLVRLLPLTGPIDRVEPARRLLVVMGTTVRLGDAAGLVERAGGATLALDRLRAGDWVAVSGIWRGSTVEASRIERLAAPVAASVSGLLRAAWGAATIGGTRIDLTATADRVDEGSFAALSGTYRNGRLVADRVASGAATIFPQPLERLVVEAYLARDPGGGGYHLSGFGIPMDPASTVPRSVSRRSIFVGAYDGDHFLIERSLPTP